MTRKSRKPEVSVELSDKQRRGLQALFKAGLMPDLLDALSADLDQRKGRSANERSEQQRGEETDPVGFGDDPSDYEPEDSYDEIEEEPETDVAPISEMSEDQILRAFGRLTGARAKASKTRGRSSKD